MAESKDGPIELTLLHSRSKIKKTPARSGINWGQRLKRDRDQAYINISARIANLGFFPQRGKPFKVLTDDGFEFTMVRRQDAGKGLQTPESNALLGAYFRKRMGIPSGQFVTLGHLEAFGRTSVAFTKKSNGVYLMDFNPDNAAN